MKAASQNAHVSLSLPNPHRAALARSFVTTAGGTVGGPPSAWNAPEFVCYGVNVTGPGISDTSSKPDLNPDLAGLIAGTTSCAYRGIVSKGFTFTAGGGEIAIDLQVPPGANRVIQLIGITNPEYCASNFLEKGGVTAPGAYEIGRVRSDLFADTTVSIPITYVASPSKRVDCGNGSAATLPPAASALGWSETSPRSMNDATAAWTISTSATAASQTVQLYSDPACSVPSGNPASLSTSANSQVFPGLVDGVYAYIVTTADVDGTVTPSPCSPPMQIDTVIPAPASALTWAGPSPTHNLVLNASWTRSTSPDLAHQYVRFYSDSTCTTQVGVQVTVDPPLSTAAFTAPGDGIYAYALYSYDAAANSILSSCSPPMIVDTTPPTVSISSPAAGSYVNATNVSAFAVSGTCSENALSVTVSGAATATVACASGAWTAALNFVAAPDGAVAISATQIDLAGNVSGAVSRSFMKDIGAPTVAIAAPAASSYVNQASVGAFMLSGTCSENGRSVVVSGAASGTTPCTSGAFSVSLDLTAAADGAVTLFVDHSDAAGNAAIQSSRVFIKDVVVPNLSAIAIANPTPSYTKILNLTYGSLSEVILGYCILVNQTSVGSCSWVMSPTLPPMYALAGGDLASGSKVLTMYVKDTAGNLSAYVQTPSVFYDPTCDTLAGAGTAGAPYQLNSPTAVRYCIPMVDGPGKYFKLMSSFPYSGITSPVPTLQGDFDGNGQTLQNVTLNLVQDDVGVFGVVSGSVRNLNIDTGVVNCGSGKNCGMVAGRALGSAVFQNIAIGTGGTWSVTAAENSGGIVGTADGAVRFLSNALMNAYESISGGARFGGIVGYYRKTTGGGGDDFFQNRVAGGQVLTSSCGNEMGGLVGELFADGPSVTITLRENTAFLNMSCAGSAQTKHGGLVGWVDFGASNGALVSLLDSNVLGGNTPPTGSTYAGGILGMVAAGTGTSNHLVIDGAVARSLVSGSVNVGGILGGSDNNGQSLPITINNSYFYSQSLMTAAVIGTYVTAPVLDANTTTFGAASVSQLQNPSYPVGGSIDNPLIWTKGTGVYPRLTSDPNVYN